MKKEIYKVGFARRGVLNHYWNKDAFPSGISVEDLRLSEMVPNGEEKCMVFKPLGDNTWYLLCGIHRGTKDRTAAVVAARVFNRPVAEELLAQPEKLFRLGLFLRDEETAEAVEHYQTAMPENKLSWEQLPELEAEWESAKAVEEQVRLVVVGILKAGNHQELQFLNVESAALRGALEKVPVTLSINCGFSLPFNKMAGCCTDLNLLPAGGAERMMDERGEGWPNKARSALSRGRTVIGPDLCLAVDAIMRMDSHTQWQDVFGRRGEQETLELLGALGAVQEAEQAGLRREQAVSNLVETFHWNNAKATSCVKELDKLIGSEKTSVQSEKSNWSRGESVYVQKVQPMVCPCAKELEELLRRRKRKEHVDRIYILSVFAVMLLGVVVLLLAPLGQGEQELSIHLHLAMDAKSVGALVFTLALGVCLGRIGFPGGFRRE